jgi:hypothetical protein
MKHLDKIRFIGDLSLEDADVLAKYGKQASSILEFGVGGSTQIFAQCIPNSLISVDTDESWVDATNHKLFQIDEKIAPVFLMYDEPLYIDRYDLIFVDGLSSLRLDFAQKTWEKLNAGGVMIFHDTRRFEYFKDVAWIAQLYFNEIENIEINAKASNDKSSNMTVIKKKQAEPYVNWNYTEGKPLWAYGTQDKDKTLWQQN